MAQSKPKRFFPSLRILSAALCLCPARRRTCTQMRALRKGLLCLPLRHTPEQICWYLGVHSSTGTSLFRFMLRVLHEHVPNQHHWIDLFSPDFLTRPIRCKIDLVQASCFGFDV